MSADLLRRAAYALREHAEAATRGPWYRAADHERATSHGFKPNAIGFWDGEYAEQISYHCTGDGEAAEIDARYIALMHPPVALAVADWLDKSALIVSTYSEEHLARIEQIAMEPLAVARAILREAAPA